LASKVLFFNQVSFKSKFNEIGVWCSLVQRSLAHFQTFLLLKKIADFLDFVEKLKIADLSPNWTIFSRAKVL
jgi:hypothetical protein